MAFQLHPLKDVSVRIELRGKPPDVVTRRARKLACGGGGARLVGAERAAMEPARDGREDRPDNPASALPMPAAMEPARDGREDFRALPAAAGHNLPQWSPPVTGGRTTAQRLNRAELAWATLSQAGHHHAYELGLTAAELRRLRDEVQAIIRSLQPAEARQPS